MSAVVVTPTSSAAISSLSIVLHAAIFFALGVLPTRMRVDAPPPPQEVSIQVEEPPPPPPPEPATPEPPAPAPVPEPEVRAAPVPRAPNAPPPPAQPNAPPPPPPAEEVLDFDNTTLTNENGDFAMSAGSGRSSDQPARNLGRGLISDRNVAGQPGGVRDSNGNGPATNAPRLVPVSSLSRRPRPPTELNEALERNYPRDAREQELEGRTLAKVTIQPDGSIGSVRILEGDDHGFGAACRRTLQGAGRWTPPLDDAGNPVAVEIEFRCEFTIRR